MGFFEVGGGALDLSCGGFDFFELCAGLDLTGGFALAGGGGLGFLNVGAAFALAGAGGLDFFNVAGALDVIGEVGARCAEAAPGMPMADDASATLLGG